MPEPIEVFRAGTHTTKSGLTLTFTDAQLSACAKAYDPAHLEAPLVIGHPENDTAPAYGWVGGVTYRDGSLWIDPVQVDPDFAEMVNAGRYKKISSAFYGPQTTGNPVPGSLYLRHVGFLGAVPPAVKGMKDAAFSGGGDGVLTFDGFGDEAGSRTLEYRERAIGERERIFRRRENEGLLNRLIGEARFPIGGRGAMLAFLDGLNDDTVIEFSEGDGVERTGALSFMTGFLSSLPPSVSFAQIATGESDPLGDGAASNGEFEAPPGYTVSEKGAKLHRAALDYQRTRGGGYGEAVRAVSGLKPGADQ